MYELVEHKKLTSNAASIVFDNIPQNGTDLVLVCSLRSNMAGTVIKMSMNDLSTNNRRLQGSGSGLYTAYNGPEGSAGFGNGNADSTSNTFSSNYIHITNYSSSTANKSFSSESVTENNATTAYQQILAGIFPYNNPVTKITLAPDSAAATEWIAGSSVTLYKLNRTSALGAPKAVGGNITYANGYWVHTFTGSGTFSANENLIIDALVVAGGGGGGTGSGGGGGAGGFLASSSINLLKGSYPIAIGSGGTRTATDLATQGSNSSFQSMTAIGGGGGASVSTSSVKNGGSGGGGRYDDTSGGTNVSGQGFAGGNAVNNPYAGAGGGGAGAAGGNVSSANGAPGGIGAIWNGAYYAGGGGGGADSYRGGAGGAAGLGGGGRGANYGELGVNGTANTGGGGGGGQNSVAPFIGGAGGSGVVIIRYRAD